MITVDRTTLRTFECQLEFLLQYVDEDTLKVCEQRLDNTFAFFKVAFCSLSMGENYSMLPPLMTQPMCNALPYTQNKRVKST